MLGKVKLRWIGVLLGFVISGSAFFIDYGHAVPAYPKPFWVKQPDGTSFRVKLIGDEWSNALETDDGYAILKDEKTGNYVYAQRGTDGKLGKTEFVVGKDFPFSIEKHLRFVSPLHDQMLKMRQNTFNQPLLAPNTGTQKLLVILVNFTNQTLQTTETDWYNKYFGTTNSVQHFYKETSYNNLVLSPAEETYGTANNGVVVVSLNYAHPNSGSGFFPQSTVKDAISAADSLVNFASFDTDASGYIETNELHTTLIIAGYEESYYGSECGNSVWGHWLTFLGGAPVVDGVTVASNVVKAGYTVFGEWNCNMFDSPGHIAQMGIMVHELGHDLQLPDLYDIDYSSNGIGTWSVMAGGSWNQAGPYPMDSPAHFDAFSKWYEGWLTPTQITTGQSGLSFSAVETATGINHGVYQLLDNPTGLDWIQNTQTGTGEYFLLENRQKIGYDAGLPSSGLLIWHINETANQINSGTNSSEGTLSQRGIRLVALEQADGMYELECYSGCTDDGDTGDPFPGSSNKTSFNDTTTPNSKLYDGTATNISILNISVSGQTMTADVCPPSASIGVPVASVVAGNAQATVSWTSVSGASSYNLYMASQSGVTKTNYATLTEGMLHTGITTSPYIHTGLTNGTTYYFVVTSVNSCGESSESTEVSAKPVLETTAPVISSLSATDAGDTATVTWTTDELSDSIVDYGTTTGYGSTATSASLVISHSVTLTGLSGNTLYNYRVKSADTWGNSVTSSNTAFTTKTKIKYSYLKGITMISLPMAVSSSASSLFGAALEKFGRWNTQGNVYDVSSSFSFSAGNGYWVKLTADKYFEVVGTPAPATQNFEVAIYPGWNQIGNPFLQSYKWEDVSVKQDYIMKKLKDAVDAKWIGSYAWSYPGQAFGYQLTHPDKEGASRYLSPLYGYWIYSGISGRLVFDYTKIGATAKQVVDASSDNILSVQIKAATDAAADDGSFFGITKVKTEDSIQKPPDPIENRLKTYFAGGGEQTASDFHFNPSQKEQVWDFVVECDGTKNVTLSWDIKTLPSGAKLFLQDMESGAPMNMATQNSMTVSVNEKKTFKIKYYKPSALSESGKNGALFASKPYMFPNPDRTGNATFRYVTGPNVMRVGIEVYNLAGKLVDKFEGNLNGETHWLFGDRVAAGVYYYRITAYAADGKESVVGKMVVVR